MYQQITLIGNLGRDPEMRYTPSGTPVTSFNVAVNRSWTGQDGQRQDKTTWFRISAWQRLAETCNQFLTKGQRVLVVGEVEEPSTWTDREGNTRASLEVRARTVRFLNTRAEGEALAAASGQSGGQSGGWGGGGAAGPEPGGEDDIPF
ncbi:MAG: single-stranded DNA-binding protein [Caldilineaceae bacterium]|nr:single-stranded DNA-binding protein [Caldilineaceae bacterium]MCY4115264.1 single-stranded DNA-binding protein [Caldilineaceae bacterium]MDE0070186.1 single-stranded DNA-binding protein [Caldilineaceae bacterium]